MYLEILTIYKKYNFGGKAYEKQNIENSYGYFIFNNI